jgi:1-deoxy-D-xylulose-5-phosphate synthase
MEELGEVLRHVLVPGHVFEELGVNYIGPLDGHDMDRVTDALSRAKRLPGPTLLHFLTEKGRGYEPAGDDPERAHGVKPSKASEAALKAAKRADAGAKLPGADEADPPARRAYTAIFGEAVQALAAEEPRVHAITAAMPSGTGLSGFADAYPERFHDTGITEQHAVALAGGMAAAGLRPVAAIYSTFLQRGYDQVFQEVALQGARVVLALDRAGLVGQDGPTHMGLYDLAFLRPLPGFTLASPRDAVDLGRMLRAGVAADGGPWALRWPRGSAAEAIGSAAEHRPPLEPGLAEKLRDGRDGAVFALGALVEPALAAAERLEREQDLYLEVWDARFCKPLDRDAILGAARRTGRIATVEEHGVQGGFGAAVAELLAAAGERPVLHLHGVADRFVAHMTSREEQLAACGLDEIGLARVWSTLFAPVHDREQLP